MIKRIFALALALAALASPAIAGSAFTWTQLQSINKTAFLGSTNQAAVSADFSCTELWNPAASGKILLVWSVNISQGVAGITNMGTTTTELSTTGGNAPANKYGGAAAGVALLRIQAETSTFSYPGGTVLFAQQNPANTPFYVPFTGPVVVPAGMGIATCNATANDQNLTVYEWDEVPG